ncbi:MAG: hypothetical protein ACKOCW_04485 [Planctomycetaceae bacterium]
MTSRERWTVYPLVFLALGLAMRAVLVPPERVGEIEAIRVTCRELIVVEPDGTSVIHAGRVAGAGGGRIELNDADGTTAVAIDAGSATESAAIEFFDGDGRTIDRLLPAGTMTSPAAVRSPRGAAIGEGAAPR